METKTNKTKFRRYLNKVGAYRNHWITAFNILEFNKYLSNEDNYKRFNDFAFGNNWIYIKRRLFINDYEVKEDLKIKRIKK